jgi:MFS family permease
LSDILATVRDIAGNRVVVCMTLLAGGASLFVGNAHQAQMPEFAHDLGHGEGLYYSLLLAGNAAGALTAGIVLESGAGLQARPRTAFLLVMGWCLAIAGFAASELYALAFTLLVIAGFLELSFSSMAQTLVQLGAPAPIRGRVIGLFNTAFAGLRAFSGVTVGMAGEFVGIHWSLAASALVLLACTLALFAFLMRAAHAEIRTL